VTRITFRAATLADAERLAEQSILAYPSTGATVARRAERLRAGQVAPIETMTIAERDGTLVGAARTIAYRGFIGGVATPIGGLASVAVAPEARRTGVAAALVRRHVADLRAVRTPWSFLYPFAPRFYARHGWAAAARRLRWRVRPGALPLFPDRDRIRRIDLAEAPDRALVQDVYERMAPRTNGSLSRSADQLGWRHEGKHAVGVSAEDGLSGYLIYGMRAPTPRPQTLVVEEWLAEDGAAERALIGFLAAQRDQVEEVMIDTPEDHPLGAVLENDMPAVEDDGLPEEHHPLATLASGLMARVVDLGGALDQRGYPGVRAGAVAVTVTEDPIVAENVATMTAVVEGGVAHAEPGAAAGAPVVAGPIGPISAILCGALRVGAAARLGLVSVGGDAARAEAILALPPLNPLIAF